MIDVYEIDIFVTDIQTGVMITGDDLTALEACILPIVKSLCETKGYKSDYVYISIDISKNGDYYDHEEDEFEWVLIEP